jgi:hypothetical protein
MKIAVLALTTVVLAGCAGQPRRRRLNLLADGVQRPVTPSRRA